MALLLETSDSNPVFTQELTKLLSEQMDHILTTEEKLKEANNGSVKNIIESKKIHSLEKLSVIELQSIKEDLLRQSDLMSKRLYRRTQRNKVLEKERENVHSAIQEEGKMLINKCNLLRKEGLLLMYKIGLAKKEAEELTNEMRKNFSNSQKLYKDDDDELYEEQKKGQKKTKLLPIDAYRLNAENKRKAKRTDLEPSVDDRMEHITSLKKYLMQKADQLYNHTMEQTDSLRVLQVSEFLLRLHLIIYRSLIYILGEESQLREGWRIGLRAY